MALDYQEMRQENERRYGTDIGRIGKMLFTDTYADRTHFIFELLQNAEDALYRRGLCWNRSREVSFNLTQGQLRFSHFGAPFNEKDVRGVCGIAMSTKSESLTEIGRFGIGFKSVYAFTNRPEIHSGPEDFAIENFVWPEAVSPIGDKRPDETIILLPFKIDDESSHHEVANGLRNLGARTLLFLRHIEEISWSIDGEGAGQYLRETKDVDDGVRHVTVIGEGSITGEIHEEYLIFSRALTTDRGIPAGHVEIAFSLDPNSQRIQPTDDSRLVAFFPTKVYTSVGFLIQGPYRTTPNRENVPEHDEWNRHFIDKTSLLLKKALSWLRDKNLLDADVIRYLPIKKSNYYSIPHRVSSYSYISSPSLPPHSRFAPLFDATKEAFESESLLPRLGEGYISAEQALIGRGEELRELFSSKQLSELFGVPGMDWLTADITQDRVPEVRDYLMQELEVREETPESVLRRLRKDFLESQPDEWIVKLYRFLNSQRAVARGIPNSGLRILRLESGSHVPVNGQAFLPGKSKTDFPTVRSAICADDEALTFLKSMGLREPDPVDDVMKYVLPKYGDGQIEVDDASYADDLNRILSAYDTDSSSQRAKLIEALKTVRFIRAVDAGSKSKHWSSPGQVYWPTDTLDELFDGVMGVLFVEDSHEHLDREEIRKMLEKCGVSSYLKRVETTTNFTCKERSDMRRGEGSTRQEPVQDWTLLGLDGLLNLFPALDSAERTKRAKLLWDVLMEFTDRQGYQAFSGTYQWFYYSWKVRKFQARFIKCLNNTPWVPDADGQLKLPKDVQFALLGWKEHPLLQSKISFEPPKSPVIEALAQETGIELETLELIHKFKITPHQLRELVGKNSVSYAQTGTQPGAPMRTHTSSINTLPSSPVAPENGSVGTNAGGHSVTNIAKQPFAEIFYGVHTINPSDAPHNPVALPYGGPRTTEAAIADTRQSGEIGRSGSEVQRRVTRWEPTEAARELADKFREMVHGDYGRRCQICGTTFRMSNGESQVFVVHVVAPSADDRTNHFGNLLGLCGHHYALMRYGHMAFTDPK